MENNLYAAKLVNDTICSYIKPFSPGLVELYVITPDSLTRNAVVRVTSTTFEEEFIIDGSSLYLLPSEASMALWIGEQAGKYFAGLMNEPVPATIVLGEN